MISKRFFTVALTSTLLTLSAQATTYVKCVGATPQETLQFLVDEEQGVAIFQVSEELCEGYVSVEDDAVFLGKNEKQKSKSKAAYSAWLGNWGFDLKIPKALSEGLAPASKTFSVDYKFTYSDIDEAQSSRTLSCSINTEN